MKLTRRGFLGSSGASTMAAMIAERAAFGAMGDYPVNALGYTRN